jgi:hypothetical protein
MRVRVIFRGLVLFQFEKSRDKMKADRNRGALTAWFIGSQPSTHHPEHVHKPHIGIIGRDKDKSDPTEVETDPGIVAEPIPLLPGETRLEMKGCDCTPGVIAAPGFLEYVPSISQIYGSLAPKRAGLSLSSVVIPHGTIRARDLVSWDADANVPAEVAFMDTGYRGFVANEVVVDMGDDSDMAEDGDEYLQITTETEVAAKKLWPLTKNHFYKDATDPNTVEILFTNFAPQRLVSLFWSLHFQMMFQAAGFPPRTVDASQEFENFEQAALTYDPGEWVADKQSMGVSQPFPYIVNGGYFPGRGPKQGYRAENIQGPPASPHGRERGVRARGRAQTPAYGTVVTDHTHIVEHDPWARPICPVGDLH